LDLHKAILQQVVSDPLVLRKILSSKEIQEALGNIGLFVKKLELHAPSKSSKRLTGLGETLCGRRGTRHAKVTCRQCKSKRVAGKKSKKEEWESKEIPPELASLFSFVLNDDR